MADFHELILFCAHLCDNSGLPLIDVGIVNAGARGQSVNSIAYACLQWI